MNTDKIQIPTNTGENINIKVKSDILEQVEKLNAIWPPIILKIRQSVVTRKSASIIGS